MYDPPVPPAFDSPDLTAGLNPVQRDAVLFGDGPLLVLAGAGSGKTRVLTRRIADLILRRHIPPDRILAVTFTNKAAGEMRDRVEHLLEYPVSGLWIGTFHSICLRLLRRHADRIGFRDGLTVFDDDDQSSLLKEVLKAHGQEAEAPRVRDVKNVISMAKNRLWTPDDLASEWSSPHRDKMVELYRLYQARLRAQGGVDFDDILVLAVRLLEDDRELGDRYADKFRHVLVDEFQDTNHVQLRLVLRLAAAHGNLLVVGDDDQSIYRWRGADITNILGFERHFPRATVLSMTQNYRSTQTILAVAHSVVRHNEGRREKELWTENEAGAPTPVFLALDEEEEARAVVGRIRESLRDPASGTLRRPGEIAVLYRVHAQSRPLEEACLQIGVPYAIVGGTAFYQRREVKDLIAYLRVAANPLDRVSFRRAIAAPRRGIGDAGLDKFEAAADAAGLDLMSALRGSPADLVFRGKARKAAQDLGELIRELRDRSAEGPEPLLKLVLERTDYESYLREQDRTEFEERRANLLELLEGAARFHQARPDEAGLAAWLDQVALYTNLDGNRRGEQTITFMTVHNAKGLEYPVVYVVGVEEGLFPHASSMFDPEELEEERRLFYVAATRAMKELHLSASMERRRVHRMAEGGPSRFLRDLPEDRIEFRRSTNRPAYGPNAYGSYGTGRGAPLGGSRGPRLLRDGPEELPDFADLGEFAASGRQREEPVMERPSGPSLRGRTVRHAIYGLGRVVEEDGRGGDARLIIDFPTHGRKKIVARFVAAVTAN